MSFFDPGTGKFLNLDEYAKRLLADLRPLSAAGLGVGSGERPYESLGRQMIGRWNNLELTTSVAQMPYDQPFSREVEIKIAGWLAPGSEVMLTDTGLAAAVRQVTKQIDRRLFDGLYTDKVACTSAPEPDDTPPVSLEDVVEIVKEFRRRAIERPYLQEIWFVNKPVDYHRFIGAFPARRPDEAVPGQQPHIWELLHGIPVFAWDRRAELDACESQEDWTSFFRRLARVPHIAMLPGIWLKLSNGRSQMVEDVADLIAAFEASSSA